MDLKKPTSPAILQLWTSKVPGLIPGSLKWDRFPLRDSFKWKHSVTSNATTEIHQRHHTTDCMAVARQIVWGLFPLVLSSSVSDIPAFNWVAWHIICDAQGTETFIISKVTTTTFSKTCFILFSIICRNCSHFSKNLFFPFFSFPFFTVLSTTSRTQFVKNQLSIMWVQE